MNCPNCTSEMERVTRHGVVIDHCPACGGVWLDRGELEHLIEAVRPAIALDNPDPTPPRPQPAQPAPQGGFRGKRYTTQKPRKPVRFEDRDREPAPRPGHARRYGGRYSAKARMKNLLEEIFDFD